VFGIGGSGIDQFSPRPALRAGGGAGYHLIKNASTALDLDLGASPIANFSTGLDRNAFACWWVRNWIKAPAP
jgi:hypothetical protein